MTELSSLLDGNGQEILWRMSFTIGGHIYTAKITRHWFAGHGIVAGRFRWTVYFENEYRPIAAQGVCSDVPSARRRVDRWVTEFRVAVAGTAGEARP